METETIEINSVYDFCLVFWYLLHLVGRSVVSLLPPYRPCYTTYTCSVQRCSMWWKKCQSQKGDMRRWTFDSWQPIESHSTAWGCKTMANHVAIFQICHRGPSVRKRGPVTPVVPWKCRIVHQCCLLTTYSLGLEGSWCYCLEILGRLRRPKFHTYSDKARTFK